MLTSEEEAKEKWCPFSRAAVYQQVGRDMSVSPACNRQHILGAPNILIPEASLCIGSGCMSWRWAGWHTKAFGTIAPDPSGNSIGPRLGYCGLAGKPYGAP